MLKRRNAETQKKPAAKVNDKEPKTTLAFTFSLFTLKNFASLHLCVLIFLLSSTVSAGTTVAAYRAKIHEAKLLVDNLFYGDEDEKTGARNANIERETIKQLRLALPLAEKIEAKNISIETQNKWFSEQLDAYEKEKDVATRQQILGGISERLGTIEAKIDELEDSAAAIRSKDEDKRKLAEILSREEFRKPEPPQETILQRILRTIEEWLDKFFPQSSPFSDFGSGLSSLSVFLQLLIYLVVLGGIAFLVYKFAPFLSRKFGFGKSGGKSERVILGERLAADADSQTLFAEAERLAREGQLRQAIRKGYIALLCELSDRRIIGLAKNKTNRDYLRDVRQRAEIFDGMKDLTINFERNWYGFGSPEEADWNEFRENYRKIVKN